MKPSWLTVELSLGAVKKQCSYLVPKIAAQHEQAGNKHPIPDQAHDKPVRLITRNQMYPIGSQPAEDNGKHKHHQPDAVSGEADPVRRAVLFQKPENSFFNEVVTGFICKKFIILKVLIL